MTARDFIALLPLIIMGTTPVIAMLWIGLTRRMAGTSALSITGMALSLLSLPFAAARAPHTVTALLQVDGYALFYMGLFAFAAFVVGLMSLPYFKQQADTSDEFFVLLPLATAGAMAMACATHFASLYLGLEVLSISLYTMIAYIRTSRLGTEAAVKYLVLAGAGAAFLLFGMALVYAELGSLSLGAIAATTTADNGNGVLLLGFSLMLVGVSFKLSTVPFHLWTADVYQGAPAPVAAFLATVSKGAVFAFMLRYFALTGSGVYSALFNAFALLAIASMFTGNLLALRQRNVKRLLAYSSIAHVGYMALAFLSGGEAAIEAGAAYLTAYFITTLGTFGVVTLLSAEKSGDDACAWEDFQGLLHRRPALGGVFALMLFSLAGLPLTAGFIGKFYLVKAGINGSHWLLLTSLIINSGIGLYYYLRLALAVCAQPEAAPSERAHVSWSGAAVLAIVTVGLLWVGVFPTGLINTIHHFILANH